MSFATKYRKQLLDTGEDPSKTASKELVHKAAEVTGEFIGNKIADKIVKPNHAINDNPRNIEEMIIPPETREEMLNEVRKVI